MPTIHWILAMKIRDDCIASSLPAHVPDTLTIGLDGTNATEQEGASASFRPEEVPLN